MLLSKRLNRIGLPVYLHNNKFNLNNKIFIAKKMEKKRKFILCLCVCQFIILI